MSHPCQRDDSSTPCPSPAACGRRPLAVLACLLGLAGAGLTGCQEPVLTPDEPRSQYDRFDTVRDQRAPSYVFDEFGSRKPNIRARLLTGE